MAKARKPTPKEAAFVQEYLVDLCAAAAARRAGYSARTAKDIGRQVLKRPHVAAAVARAKAERGERVKIDADWVLKEAVSLYRRCIQDIEPVRDRRGRQIHDEETGRPLFTFKDGTAARALELIGKHIDVGAFEDRVAVKSDLTLIEQIYAARPQLRKPDQERKVIDVEADSPMPRLESRQEAK